MGYEDVQSRINFPPLEPAMVDELDSDHNLCYYLYHYIIGQNLRSFPTLKEQPECYL